MAHYLHNITELLFYNIYIYWVNEMIFITLLFLHGGLHDWSICIFFVAVITIEISVISN